jgi:hypothetical protein
MRSMMRTAIEEDFKPNALLERISDQVKVRILDHVRGDEFTSIHEGVQVEITIHAREANCYNLIADDATQYFEIMNSAA